MGGDEVRLAAARVQSVADDLRGIAQQVGGAEAVSWHSVAATRFRERLRVQRAHVRRVAEELDAAAAALRRHGHAVDAAPVAAPFRLSSP